MNYHEKVHSVVRVNMRGRGNPLFLTWPGKGRQRGGYQKWEYWLRIRSQWYGQEIFYDLPSLALDTSSAI